jgi:putative oligomerization/nucleic acid binding protein
MGLIRGIARTAVVAGTATAVSNRVSRRQQARWAQPEQPQQPQQPEPVQTAPADDLTAQLNRLSSMRQSGQLSDEEFAAAKAKLLGI